MPLNESSSKPRRERWPLSYELEGIPREERQRLLDAHREAELESPEEETMARNSFTVDKPTVEISDINNPPKKNYNPHAPENEFKKMLYHHETGRILEVKNEKEQRAALKRGFDMKPSPNHDYSKVRGGIAPKADHGPKREEEMSAEELAALDETEDQS